MVVISVIGLAILVTVGYFIYQYRWLLLETILTILLLAGVITAIYYTFTNDEPWLYILCILGCSIAASIYEELIDPIYEKHLRKEDTAYISTPSEVKENYAKVDSNLITEEPPVKSEKSYISTPSSDYPTNNNSTCQGDWAYMVRSRGNLYLNKIPNKSNKNYDRRIGRNEQVCIVDTRKPPKETGFTLPWNEVIYKGQHYWAYSNLFGSQKAVSTDRNCDYPEKYIVRKKENGNEVYAINVHKRIESLENGKVSHWGVVAYDDVVCVASYKTINIPKTSETRKGGVYKYKKWAEIRLKNGETGWVAKFFLSH